MKKFTLTITAFALSIVLSLAQPAQPVKAKPARSSTSPQPRVVHEKAEILFDTLIHDFGTITDGKNACYDFKFANIGKEPLILYNVQYDVAIANWTSEPTAPGKTALITGCYYPNGRLGPFTKTINVISNGITKYVTLTIKGVVVAGQPEISFDTLVHNFDTIPEGPDGVYEFKFTNTGTAPLIISDVRGSGVTVADFVKEPVLPGRGERITIRYPTNGRPGYFTKTSCIYTNATTNPIVLTVHGYVKPK